MNLSNTNRFSPDSPTNRKQRESSLMPSSPSSRPPGSTPTRQPSPRPMQNGFAPPPRLDSLEHRSSSPALSHDVSGLDTTSAEGNDQWSSATTRATVGGKSGRVIDRLMQDVERMQREIKLLTVKYEEEARRSESARALVESLQTTNANLSSICEANNVAMARKDRKIEELKADLESERARRVRSEAQNKEISMERDDVVAACKKDLMEEKEVARKTSSQYEVLSSSWRGLDDGYRRQMQKLKEGLKELESGRQEDQVRIDQLNIVFTQLNKEAESSQAEKQYVVKQFEQYKQDKEDSIRQMKEQAERNELANDNALQEMNMVVGQMKYVINLKRNVRGAE
ncbi:hypothetical protein MMC30_003466 [Trapelia coarctata]|nr:hypothetical protein [Trapelia coarctata]